MISPIFASFSTISKRFDNDSKELGSSFSCTWIEGFDCKVYSDCKWLS